MGRSFGDFLPRRLSWRGRLGSAAVSALQVEEIMTHDGAAIEPDWMIQQAAGEPTGRKRPERAVPLVRVIDPRNTPKLSCGSQTRRPEPPSVQQSGVVIARESCTHA